MLKQEPKPANTCYQYAMTRARDTAETLYDRMFSIAICGTFIYVSLIAPPPETDEEGMQRFMKFMAGLMLICLGSFARAGYNAYNERNQRLEDEVQRGLMADKAPPYSYGAFITNGDDLELPRGPSNKPV